MNDAPDHDRPSGLTRDGLARSRRGARPGTFRHVVVPRLAWGLATMLGAALAPGAARADDRLWLSGGEYASTAYYGYAGVVLPGPGRANGQGFLQRWWVDRFGYEYDGGPGRVQAEAWGAEGALGYGRSSAAGWWSAWLGLRHTNTTLSPDDRTATARGSQLGAKLQLETERAVAERWRVGAMASYTTTQGAYWARVRAMRSAGERHATGAEASIGGNDESHSESVGLVHTWRTSAGWSVGVKGGYRLQRDANGAYGGLELGCAF